MPSPPDDRRAIRPGDRPSAKLWERLRRVAMRAGNLTVAAPLELVDTPDGRHIRLAASSEFWAKLWAPDSAGKYPWTEQIPTEGGGWVDGQRTGTVSSFPAVEVNGNTSIASGTIVRLLDPRGSKTYPFIYSMCG